MKRFVWASAVVTLSLWANSDLHSQEVSAESRPAASVEPGAASAEGSRGGGSERGTADRFARLEGFARSLDANGNGIVEPNEIPPDRARSFQAFAQRLGLDPTQPMPIARIRESVNSQASQDNRVGGANPADATRSGTSEKKGDTANPPKTPLRDAVPLVPGFGSDQVPGFGESPVVQAAAPPKTTVAAGQVSPQTGDSRIRAFRTVRFRRYDVNGSGVLEKEEWGAMPGEPQAIDLNHDGRITLEEFVVVPSDTRTSAEKSSASGEEASPQESSDSTAVRKSYRFRAAQERFPQGLPSWFSERDRNQDGQVSMAEYASSWSDNTAREFAELDLNGDGLLTPQECLKNGKAEAVRKGAVAADATPPANAPGGAARSMGNRGDGSGHTGFWWLQ